MEQIIGISTGFSYNWLMGQSDDAPIDFATLCKEIRTELDITQKEMAARLGVNLRSYQRYEAGDMKPAAEAAYRLAIMDMERKLKKMS